MKSAKQGKQSAKARSAAGLKATETKSEVPLRKKEIPLTLPSPGGRGRLTRSPWQAGSPFLLKVQGMMPAMAFFALYAVCLWKWINVALIYHGSGQVQDFPSFYWGWGFARDCETHPGGAIEYGSALLAQAMYSSWFGALVLTLQAAATYGALAGCLRRFGASSIRLVALIPPLLLLAVYCRYRHYSAQISSFALGAVAAYGWLRLRPTQQWWRTGAALVALGCLYSIAPMSILVFLPVAVLCEWASGARWLWVVFWLALAAVVPPMVGRRLFGFAPGEAFAKLLPFPWDPIVLKMAGVRFVIALYVIVPLFCVGVGLWWLLRKARRAATDASSGNPASTPNPSHTVARNWWRFELPIFAAVPVMVAWVLVNPRIKAVMEVDYLAWQGRWHEVLEAAQANPKNTFVACTAAQASYHTGSLIQQLPNLTSPADLLLANDKEQSHWKKSDLYYDLGYVNMALHHLTESMEFYGERPALLRRLALVNLALTNLSTAEVYLGTLAKAPFQSAWARHYVELLKIDPTLDRDEEIGRLRRLMVRRDSVLALKPDEELLMLLGSNRQNRMAFEYLMTYYLMSKNLEGFVKQLPRVQDFSGFTISPLWDEALVLASRLSGRSVQVPGHTVSPEAITRVETVTRQVQQDRDKPELARKKLAVEYGHTYTFYWWFHE